MSPPRAPRFAPILAAILLAGLGAAPARAYERSTVDDDPSTALFWRFRTVRVYADEASCADLPSDQTLFAIRRSIATWNVAAAPCSDLLLEEAGPPSGRGSNLFGGNPDGENRIVWREDDWPEDVPDGTLAITSVVYRRASGQILDADIDLNGRDYLWTDTTEPTLADTDVENTLTHELGHLLGLAHANDPLATMYFESVPGDLEKRSLAEDDIAGLCFVYPARLLSPGAPTYVNPPLTTCAIAPARRGAWMPAVLSALLALAMRGARRRRSRRACVSRRGSAPSSASRRSP